MTRSRSLKVILSNFINIKKQYELISKISDLSNFIDKCYEEIELYS